MPDETSKTTGSDYAADIFKRPASSPAGQEGQARLSVGAIGSFSKGNLVLVGLFAASIACVYLLSLRSTPTAASAEQRRTELHVESALSLLVGPNPTDTEKSRRARAVLDAFYCQAAQRQIPLEKLSGNPFIFRPPGEAASPAAEPLAAPPSPENPRDKELSEALTAVGQLTLQSVLMGSGGTTAMISNNILSEGQTIRGWTIISIRPREVLLKWNDQRHVLKMPQ